MKHLMLLVVLLLVVCVAVSGCRLFVPADVKDARAKAAADLTALISDCERGTDVAGQPITLQRILPSLRDHQRIDKLELDFFYGRKPVADNAAK